VRGLVLERGLFLVAAGLALGLGAAIGVTRLVGSFLYQVEPTDPLTFAGVACGFVIVAVAACLLPARKALDIDPVRALQVE
jgi:ABC-type antimicrobial peptide transport system permease subunit